LINYEGKINDGQEVRIIEYLKVVKVSLAHRTVYGMLAAGEMEKWPREIGASSPKDASRIVGNSDKLMIAGPKEAQSHLT
jgi:hypothetical protein